MKKFSSFLSTGLAVLVLASSLAACGNNDSGSVASDSNPAGGSSAESEIQNADNSNSDAQESDNPYAEKVVFTMSAIDAEKVGLNNSGEPAPVYEWLKETFNVDFEFVPMTWGDYVDQTRMWLNSNTAPDLIMLDVAPVRYGEYLEWVDAGLFRAYPDLSAYPNLQSRYESMTSGKKFEVDGQLYAWPSYLDTVGYNYVSSEGYVYRSDWAKEVGLYQEDGVYTWEEWWELTQAVVDADLGVGETIGFIFYNSYEFPSLLGRMVSPRLLGFDKNEDGDYVWAPTLEKSTEAVLMVKELYDQGLIWKDQPLQIADAAKNNFAAGKLFAFGLGNVSTGVIKSTAEAFESANSDLKFSDVVDVAKVQTPDGKLYAYQGSDQWSQTAMNADMDDVKAERWCAILDYLASDEGYYSRNFGIPGVDWKMNGDEVEILWTETDENGTPINPNGSGFWWLARAAGANDNINLVNPSIPADYRRLAKRNMEVSAAAELIPVDLDLQFFTDDAYLEKTAGLEEATYQKFAELIASPNFEAEWKAWVESKAAEIQPAVDALNQAF